MTQGSDVKLFYFCYSMPYAISSEVVDEVEFLKALKNRLGEELATFITDNFTLDYDSIIDTDDLSDSGFDASVWTKNDTNKTYVAIRGTELLFQDIIADIDLALSRTATEHLQPIWDEIT